MAKVAKNLVLHGASGKIGDQIVIRQWKGQTVLSAAPGRRDNPPTEAQATQRARFQQAVIYGKTVLTDAAARDEYEEKAAGTTRSAYNEEKAAGTTRSAYNVAVADFLHAPDIDEIDVTNYSGQPGDTIRVRVTDDFKVVQVQVAIYNSDGSLVEEGAAVQQPNEIDWVYTATQSNTDTNGDRIVIRASVPGLRILYLWVVCC
ncbi:MAG: hypothetical protein ACTSRS_23130 [Candidatus Helarchaeota archaeon]